jgi:hypothetical protein
LQNAALLRFCSVQAFATPVLPTAGVVQPRPRLLDPVAEEALERDGYAVVDFLDPDDVARLRETFLSFDVPVHKQAFGSSLQSDDLAYRQAVDVAIKAAFRPHVTRILNGYRVCFGNYTLKQPNDDLGEMPFHQDPTFVDESRYQSLGIWCPLADVDEENGCLLIVPGSHRLNRGPRGPYTSFPYTSLEPVIRERHLRPVRMKGGQAVVFCQKVFHTSPPNRGDAIRIVATSLLAPQGVPLRFYHEDPEARGKMEVFAVDDLFYTRHVLGTRPSGVTQLGVIDYYNEPLSIERLNG